MKLHCPACSDRVPASGIHLETGWAKCETCHELFRLADLVPGFPAAGAPAAERIDRPFNARATVERDRQELAVHVPAEGLRAATCGVLGFATFWLAFVAFWTCGALGLFWGQPAGAFNWAFASFSIPFWLVGFGMLGAVAWSVWGTKSVRIGWDGMRTHQRCLLWSRSRWIALDDVQHARQYVPRVERTGEQRHGVEIVYRSGSFVLPVDSEEEQRWLIEQINSFIKALAS